MSHGELSGNRLYFLDNIRLLAVLAVVALHVGIAYAPLIPWWYVTDQSKSAVFDLLVVAVDGFVMPTLFGIAGYFAVPSLQRRGPAGFLAARLRRLGLPLVVVTLTLCPVIAYLVYLGQGGTEAYLPYWLRLLPSAFDGHFTRITAENAPRLHDRLSAFHLWFLSMLLVCCGVLALHAALARRWRRRDGGLREGRGLGRFFVLALGVGLAEGLGQTAVPDAVWFGFGPFFVFQPARVPLYLGMFLLGTHAWRRHWFSTCRLPGRLWLWSVAVIAAYLAMVASGLATMGPGPKPVWIPFVHGLARTLVALAVTGGLAVFGQRYWNRAGGVGASLAASSYDLYLAHMPLVVLLQFLLARTALPALVKFGLIFPAVVALCWGASRLANRRRRLWIPAGTLAAFGACLLAWG